MNIIQEDTVVKDFLPGGLLPYLPLINGKLYQVGLVQEIGQILISLSKIF
jgi:hypothetical protein